MSVRRRQFETRFAIDRVHLILPKTNSGYIVEPCPVIGIS